MQTTTAASTQRARADGYGASSDEMPLAGYSTIIAVYAIGLGGFLTLAAPKLPDRIALGDLALMSIATHKLSRIVTKDWVTAPLRAPFTHYEKSLGSGEVLEKSRGHGLRRAFGDLLTCSWCIGPWIATGLAVGFALQPKLTRFVASIFAAVTVSDFLHHGYCAAKRLSEAHDAT